MEKIAEYSEMTVGLIAVALVIFGIVNIHKSIKTKNSFLMFISIIATIVFTIIYMVMWVFYAFYCSSDKMVVTLSFLMKCIDYIFTLLFFIGAIGFWGFSKSFKKESDKKNNS